MMGIVAVGKCLTELLCRERAILVAVEVLEHRRDRRVCAAQLDHEPARAPGPIPRPDFTFFCSGCRKHLGRRCVARRLSPRLPPDGHPLGFNPGRPGPTLDGSPPASAQKEKKVRCGARSVEDGCDDGVVLPPEADVWVELLGGLGHGLVDLVLVDSLVQLAVVHLSPQKTGDCPKYTAQNKAHTVLCSRCRRC